MISLQTKQSCDIINANVFIVLSKDFAVENYIGQKFGKWLVVGETHYNKHQIKIAVCRCECGTEKTVTIFNLKTGLSKQCKICGYKNRSDASPILGLKFGKYTVLAFDGKEHRSAQMLKCQCECGIIKRVRKTSLVSGSLSQCLQCSAKERNRARAKHNMVNTTTYNIWRSMTKRCRDPKSKSFNRYGGRGIKVCERWLIFENFVADMGLRPSGLQIDRINNDGNYEPGNCRWVTPKVNANNRVTNKNKDE